MLEDIGIRTKVLAVLALPVVVLTAAATTIVASTAADAARATALRQVAASTADLGQLTDALRDERPHLGEHWRSFGKTAGSGVRARKRLQGVRPVVRDRVSRPERWRAV